MAMLSESNRNVGGVQRYGIGEDVNGGLKLSLNFAKELLTILSSQQTGHHAFI